MFRKFTLSFASLLLIPVLLLAQDGKIRGNVTDKESGEPLIGANIVIEGTNLGASSDINGEYVILSVPPGAYTIKVTYVGYSAFTISNVRVSANMTTSQNCALSSTAVQAQAVVIVAERPLIQRNTTNTVRMTTQENIQNLPVRGVQNLMALEAGVVQQGGVLYVRGGRAGEIAYYVDGANVTNPNFSSEQVSVVQEAIEEVQLQSGGYTAEFGGGNSAVVRTTTRTGGTSLKLTADYLTDDFAKPGEQFLGTSAWGYRRGVLTLSGPLTDGIRFFLVGNHNFNRNRQYMYLEPFLFEGLTDDGVTGRPVGTLLPNNGTFELKRNYMYNNWDQSNQGQGNVVFDFNQLANVPMKLRFVGSYSQATSINGTSWPGTGRSGSGYFRNPSQFTLNQTDAYFGNVRLTHVLSPTTFYELGVSMNYRFAKTYDPTFKDDWMKYTDSVANFGAGFVDTSDHSTGWTRYRGPQNYSTIFGFQFSHPNAPNGGYSKDKQNSLGATIDFTSQVNNRWELKAGGAIEQWTIRRWAIGNISNYMLFRDLNRDGTFEADDVVLAADVLKGVALDRARRARYSVAGGITMQGYDVDGNETDGYTLSDGSIQVDKPYKPTTASAYVQNKFEYNDLIINFGARYEYWDMQFKSVEPTINPATNELDYTEVSGVDQNLNIIKEDFIKRTDPISLVLPRVSFSFPVSEKTVFYSQYGKYAQMPSLGQFYLTDIGFSNGLNPVTRNPYANGMPMFVRPERTTLFEVGLRQFLTDNFAFTFTGFYKDQTDQMQVRRTYNSLGNAIFLSYLNSDFATIKGVELTLELRRTQRISAKVNYTLSDARGTGSSPGSGSVATTDELKARFPSIIGLMPFNQTHRGSLQLDYRFAKGDGGPILEGMGLNLLATFNSGHPYTKVREDFLGQWNVWNVGVYGLADRRFSHPEEPINTSTTPWVFNLDLAWNKVFYIGDVNFELYVNVLNVFNTKNVYDVYKTTGSATDDGWFKDPRSVQFRQNLPGYEQMYKALNLDNRAELIGRYADTYGSPRVIRVGMKLEL